MRKEPLDLGDHTLPTRKCRLSMWNRIDAVMVPPVYSAHVVISDTTSPWLQSPFLSSQSLSPPWLVPWLPRKAPTTATTSLLGYYIPDLPTLRYWFISAPAPHSSDYLRFFALIWETRMPGPVSITKVHVYEVGPLPANDSLRLIAKHEVGFAASLAFHGWISKDRMYLHVKGRIIIWDFVASLVASLDDVPVETDYDDSEGHPYKVLTIGEKLVLLLSSTTISVSPEVRFPAKMPSCRKTDFGLDALPSTDRLQTLSVCSGSISEQCLKFLKQTVLTHGIHSWDIPSLQTVERQFVWESWNQSAEDWQRAAAVSTASYSRFLNDEPSSPGGRCILFEPSRWHSDDESEAHLVFTIAEYSQNDENRALTGQLRVRVEIIDGFPQAIVTSKSLPSRALASLLLRQSYMNCNRQYSLCGDRIFATTGFEMRWIQMLHSALNISGDEWEGGDCNQEHGMARAIGNSECSLVCPVSARYAYVCMHRHEGSLNHIHVVDLLNL
ncbi:hypothetical protein NMY22_g7052 [Coprinellus aureogranulatus]|nr:hypothetical protein NMY22_g7052 [Coprinellus aureogranulatus]